MIHNPHFLVFVWWKSRYSSIFAHYLKSFKGYLLIWFASLQWCINISWSDDIPHYSVALGENEITFLYCWHYHSYSKEIPFPSLLILRNIELLFSCLLTLISVISKGTYNNLKVIWTALEGYDRWSIYNWSFICNFILIRISD
jgi:hypothetical protein